MRRKAMITLLVAVVLAAALLTGCGGGGKGVAGTYKATVDYADKMNEGL